MNPFELSRDDGPIARTLGVVLAPDVRLPAITLIVAGVVPLFVLIAIEGADASNGVTGAAVAWLVLTAGVSSGRPHTGALRWAVPPLLRLAEYTTIIWLGALAGGAGPAAAFALLAALAFHHYDLFYRLRFLGVAPPQWVGDVAGGWDGRLLAAYVLLLVDALPAGLFAAAAVLGAVFAGESISSWARAERPAGYAEEGVGEE